MSKYEFDSKEIDGSLIEVTRGGQIIATIKKSDNKDSGYYYLFTRHGFFDCVLKALNEKTIDSGRLFSEQTDYFLTKNTLCFLLGRKKEGWTISVQLESYYDLEAFERALKYALVKTHKEERRSVDPAQPGWSCCCAFPENGL